jgi:hypothetical protein
VERSGTYGTEGKTDCRGPERADHVLHGSTPSGLGTLCFAVRIRRLKPAAIHSRSLRDRGPDDRSLSYMGQPRWGWNIMFRHPIRRLKPAAIHGRSLRDRISEGQHCESHRWSAAKPTDSPERHAHPSRIS